MIIFIIIPLIIASVVSFILIRNLVIEKVENTHQNVVNMMASDMNDMVDEMIDTTNLYGRSQTDILDRMKNFAASTSISSYDVYQDYREIAEYLSITFSGVSSVNAESFFMNSENLIIRGNNNVLSHQELESSLRTIVDQHWMEQKNPNRLYFLRASELDLHDINDHAAEIYAVRSYKDFVSNEMMGILFLGIPESYFEQLFQDVETGAFQLLDKEKQTLIRSARFDDLTQDNDLLVSRAALPSTDWELVYYVPAGDIMKEITSTFSFYAILIAVCVLIFLIISFYIGSTIYRPLRRLKSTVEEFGEGNLQVRFPVETKDEIGLLGRAFNHMLNQINDLLDKVKQEEAEKRKLELRALFAQIRPHFLINTLNSIKCSLLLEDDEVHSKKIESLTRLLRANMRAEELTTVKEECRLLYDYIEIMKLRSDLQIELRTNMDDDLCSFKVPRLLLQPIVENAIIHGFSDLPDSPVIEVNIKKQEEDILIKVIDNGAGMDESKREEVLYTIHHHDNLADHIGVKNVYHRLKLTYQNVTIDIETNKWGGTTFVFIISNNAELLTHA